MGYTIIKPKRGGVKSGEHFTISQGKIYISRGLTDKLGLHLRKKAVRIMIDNDTKALCFDFKDLGQLPDAFPVCIHTNHTNGRSCVVYCAASIVGYGVPTGKFTIVSQDGPIYKTDCITNPSKK
jgi:hypothetical protein